MKRFASTVLVATLGLSTKQFYSSAMPSASSIILDSGPVGGQNPTTSPWLFLANHNDNFPKGDSSYAAPRRGNGSDFNYNAPYRMYHGDRIPGFPQHPHHGITTLTIVNRGFVNHADSLGNRGTFGLHYDDRTGAGDMQVMTSGAGINHAEMFPLYYQKQENPMRLYQIWYNNPAADKEKAPGYEMIWSEDVRTVKSESGANLHIFIGTANGVTSQFVPPENCPLPPDVGVFSLRMPPNSDFTLEATHNGAVRTIYFVEASGNSEICGKAFNSPKWFRTQPDAAVTIKNLDSSKNLEALILEGKEQVNETAIQHGPFVSSSHEQLRAKFAEYRRTQFGGWPWPNSEPVFPADMGRFAGHLKDGQETITYPPSGKRGIFDKEDSTKEL